MGKKESVVIAERSLESEQRVFGVRDKTTAIFNAKESGLSRVRPSSIAEESLSVKH